MTQPADLPDNEQVRIARLQALGILDTAPEEFFDNLVELAAAICEVPISLVSLVDGRRQWFKANHGLPESKETARDIAFCAHAILHQGVMEVPDATLDARFARNPLVLQKPFIRFYAGAPLQLADGVCLGTLCVIDSVPKTLTPKQTHLLGKLAAMAAKSMESREQQLRSVTQLQYSQNQFEQLYAHTPAMLFSIDGTGRILKVSDHWLHELGYERDAVLGRRFESFVDAESAKQLHKRIIPELFGAGNCNEVEFQIRCKNGAWLDVIWSAVVERNALGIARHALCVCTNIQRRKQAEFELNAQLTYNKSLIENMGDGVITITEQGAIETANPAALKLFGYASADIIGKNINQLMPEPDAAQHDTYLQNQTITSQSHIVGRGRELLGRRNNGSVFPLELSVSRTSHLGRRAFIGIMRDISERRRLEQIQEESRQRLAELTRRFQVSTTAARIGVWEWDIGRDILVWDEVMFGLYGLNPDFYRILPPKVDTWRSCVHPADLSLVELDLCAALEGTADFDCEFRVIHADSSVHYLKSRATVERDPSGATLRMLGTNWDITEQRTAEESLRASKVFLERTGDVAGVGGWELDLKTGGVLWSDETCRLHEVPCGHRPTLEQAIGFYTPDAQAIMRQAVEAAIGTGRGFDLALQLVSAKGRHFWARAVGTVEYEHEQVVRLVGAFQDITERKFIEQALEENRQLLQVTLDSIADAVITTDVNGCVQWLNPVAEKLTGWAKSQAVNKPLSQVFNVIHEDTRAPALDPVAVCLAQGRVVGLTKNSILISIDGTEYGIQDSASPIRNHNGEILGAVLVFHDVSEQRRLTNEMSYRATHDALTGLFNRAEFENRLTGFIDKLKYEPSENALMFLDLDQFKIVNDSCGHSAGDQLLKEVTQLIQNCMRSQDVFARLGGDEFGVLLQKCDSQQALRVAQKICDQMEAYRFVHDGRRFRVGASIGLVPLDDRWSGYAAVMQAADSACYAAKEAGRNRVHSWVDVDHAMHARTGQMQWVNRIEQALDDDHFVLYGQRICSIDQSSAHTHCEVLVRMRSPDGTIILPKAFLPAAERFHMASRIDRWVVRNVFAWMESRQGCSAQVDLVGLNLSGQSIGDKAFHRYMIDMIDKARFDVSTLCLEITETAAITNLLDAKAFIEEVRRAGVKVALDDFGAGASSFGYLKNLPVDYLKIDGQFITDLLQDELDNAAVRCFQDVARVVGVKTVAEFVENAEVLRELQLIGINYAQGYLMHRPEPLDDLVALD